MDTHFQAATINDSDYTTGQIVVTAQNSGKPSIPLFAPVLGGVQSGFHYLPDFTTATPDTVYMGRFSGGTWIPLGYYLPSDPNISQYITASVYQQFSGESTILHKSGSVVHIRNDGNIVLYPANHLLLGGPTATEGVARYGDTVTVTVNGSAYSGTITGGSSVVKCL